MAQTGARSLRTTRDDTTGRNRRRGMTPAELQGDGFLGFEVNAWHNIVHVLSGVVLLAAFRRRSGAKAVAVVLGAVYGVVAVIGLIDGNDVLGILPVNAADNVLHLALAVLGIVAGLVSRADDDRGRRGAARRPPLAAAARRPSIRITVAIGPTTCAPG